MKFVDRVHVEKIAEALWSPSKGDRPGAALMVGAGMSRNAARPSLADGMMPDWNELTSKLIGELHPDAVGEEKERAELMRRAGAVSGFLRLAEEYEATHGRGALHRFLLRNVPDESVSPGQLHKDLLNLPWQDVFTTNWDTLLERTAKEQPFLGYTPVTRAEQIPRSAPPRIVKLHGSFPDIEPFIFTEEDFRTYPRKFAPFVNMMRQGLMENILVLIGFSGDDPNFLQWAGWVRDELGGAGPQVYLCGWLELREGQRRLLDKLRVITVDYSKHGDARTGLWDYSKHACALECFIKDMNELKDDGNYNSVPIAEKKTQLKSGLITIFNKTKLIKNESGLDNFLSEVFEFMKGSEFIKINSDRDFVLRKIYTEDDYILPKNSFLPSYDLIIIKKKTLNVYKKFKLYLRSTKICTNNQNKSYCFKVIELNLDLLYFIYIDSDANYHSVGYYFYIIVEKMFGKPLFTIDEIPKFPFLRVEDFSVWYKPKNPDGSSALDDLPFHVGKARLQDIWLGCLRHYRISSYDNVLKEDDFRAWAGALAAFDDHDPRVRETVWHQRCLHGLRCFDLDEVDAALEEWREADNAMIRDPYWAVREAGILAEVGRTDAAVKLAKKAFSAMQRQMQPATREALTSREVWTIVFLDALVQDEKEREQFRRRLAQTSTPEIDPLALLEKWRIEFRPDICLQHDVYGESGNKNVRNEALMTAQRFVRLIEEIGFPAFAAQYDADTSSFWINDIISRELMAAGNRMAKSTPGRSLAVCLRACFGAGEVGEIAVFKNNLLERNQKLAAQWSDRLVRALPKLLERVGRSSGAERSFAFSRAVVALTALGFLVRHTDEKARDQAFAAALTCHRHPVAAGETGLYAPLGNLFAALAAAAAPAVRQRWLGEMLAAPLPGPGGVDPYIATIWPDPFAPFEQYADWPTDAAGHDADRAARIVRGLIDRLADIKALSGNAKRKKALEHAVKTRLKVLRKAGWVSSELDAAVAAALGET